MVFLFFYGYPLLPNFGFNKIQPVISDTVIPSPAIQNISFNDTDHAFAYKSDANLKKAGFLFSLMGNRFLLRMGLKAIPFAVRFQIPFFRWLVKNTIFSQFVGGESLKDTESIVAQLASFGVGTILDYGVEGKEVGPHIYDHATAEFIKVIDYAASREHIPFMSIKMTGLMSSKMLVKLNTLMVAEKGSLMGCYDLALSKLSVSEKSEWEQGVRRVERICAKGHACNIGVWLDAEETWMQAPMDAIAFQMMEQFNKQKPLIYNTYQLYRHDRLQFLKESHEFAVQENFILGAKLVRGAYMEKERRRAAEMGYHSPIQPDKASSDRDYDAAILFCIEHLDRIAMVLGTHNEKSALLCSRYMMEKGIRKDHPHTHFSQLLGMSDNITFNLAAAGLKVSKYVPFGPINDVVPYLMRRAEENSSVKGQTGRELSLIKIELKRRKLKKGL